MGFFGGIRSAKYSEGGVYLQPGVYRLRINRCKQGKTRTGVPFFVAEFEVLESSVEEQPAGSAVSWMVQIKPDTPALGNIRSFCEVVGGFTFDAECKGLSEEEAQAREDAIVAEIVGEANVFAGTIVKASGSNIKTKQGRDFTKVVFMPDDAPAAAA